MTLGTLISPLTHLFKGDLGESKTFDTDKMTFQTSSQVDMDICDRSSKNETG
ncbi:hypothetical protein [Nostoc sp. LEGE 12450]|uniref:hypothetical protein n=1 Tax=Nostoc sp. LEGE 12450 TaxID=1828643 RepID=UPI00187F88A0|nr:hypothetical protein [Nostoc sp. LEGE 12450]MBE8987884.1 hypothetical protein [Nostoc sp. LEGE 12450]